VSKKRNTRDINSADIPEYQKIKQRENPLDSVVIKFEEAGYSPESAFMAFDEDCDDVLTIQEIKEGLMFNKIHLNDSELKLLVDAIDANHDGVVDLDEWANILTNPLKAQSEYFKIMNDIDIDDPLDLEERVLDLTFKKRRLEAEVKLMRRSRRSEEFFRNKKIKEEQKVVSEKIVDLERKVKDS
jgi:hypothetical protein